VIRAPLHCVLGLVFTLLLVHAVTPHALAVAALEALIGFVASGIVVGAIRP
jgi:hypothetical protein